jgi:predicted PurR-regulated permease PerM
VLGITLLLNQFVRLVIYLKLAGKASRLPVFSIILGLVIGGVLWGVLGVILVVPLLGTVREILTYLVRKINLQDPYPGEQIQGGFWVKEEP